MSVRSKVAGAAVLAVAPEAEPEMGAADAAGGAAGKAAKDPRRSAPGSKAAQQRQQIEDLKSRRAELEHEPSSPAGGDGSRRPPDDGQQQEGEDGRGFGPFSGMQAPATGGGMVLGLLAWGVVRAYIGTPGQTSGWAGVKNLANAKLFNKTTSKGGK